MDGRTTSARSRRKWRCGRRAAACVSGGRNDAPDSFTKPAMARLPARPRARVRRPFTRNNCKASTPPQQAAAITRPGQSRVGPYRRAAAGVAAAKQKARIRAVALLVNRGAIWRPLGLPAKSLHSRLSKW